MIKQTLFTIILLLLTFVIVKSQRNIFLIPRLHLKLPEVEIIDIPYEYNEYEKDKNASYGWWDNRKKFHFY